MSSLRPIGTAQAAYTSAGRSATPVAVGFGKNVNVRPGATVRPRTGTDALAPPALGLADSGTAPACGVVAGGTTYAPAAPANTSIAAITMPAMLSRPGGRCDQAAIAARPGAVLAHSARTGAGRRDGRLG